MSKKSMQNNKGQNNDIVVSLTKTQIKVAVIALAFSIIFSIISLVVSYHSNTIAGEANNISLLALSHQQIIEESDLQIGNPQGNPNSNSIRIPLINGYYARYPALIVSFRGWLNGREIMLVEMPYNETNGINPKNFRIVGKDNPIFLEIIFDDFNHSINDDINTIKTFTSKKNIIDGSNNLTMEIHYHDFSKKDTWTINPQIEVTVVDKKIVYVDLVYIPKPHIIKQLNQS